MKTAASHPVDRKLRACADRTRLRILNLLAGGERCVCDLVDVLRVPQPKASRHLAYLRQAGLVVARKEGLWNYYRLAPASDEFHKRLLACLACCQDLPEMAIDTRRLAAKTSCCD